MLTRLDPEWLEPFLKAVGLPPSKPLERLGQVVVLAGPNGSGKSRFIKALSRLLEQANSVRGLAARGYTPVTLREKWAAAERPEGWTEVSELPRIEQMAGFGLLYHHRAQRPFSVCDLTQPTNLTVRDASATSATDQASCVRECTTRGLEGTYPHQHVYLDAIARRLDLMHRRDGEARRLDVECANRFNDLLSSLLQTTVVPELNSAWLPETRIFERPFDGKELSSGQKVLIAWAIALCEQAELDNSIIFVDEPENHLHPDACISALEALRDKVIGDGQIWIATHSIPIIAWAGAEALFAVKGGVVSYAGNAVESVINSLSGGKERRESLRDFLAEADRFGFYHFVAQCLTPPGVVDASGSDKQEQVFARFVRSKWRDDGMLRVLDYGAGKGRLAASLGREPTDLHGLTYYLYDPDPEFEATRSAALRQLVACGATGEVLTSLGRVRVAASRVDLIVLCNVLHEIPSTDWLALFKSLPDILADDGQLVIIEDQEPSVGELPHDKGFLLLNKDELAQLFGGDPAHVEDKSPGREVADGRISVLCVCRQHMHKATTETLRRTLCDLHIRARHEVARIRAKKAAEQRDGRRHALYVALAFNAHAALDALGGRDQ